MTEDRKFWWVGVCVGLGLLGAVFVLPFAYAVSLGLRSGSWLMFQMVTNGEWLMPLRQAQANWEHPLIARVVKDTWIASAVAGLAVFSGVCVLIWRPWKIKPPEDGSRLATLRDLKQAGLLDGKPGHSVLLGTFKSRDVRYSGDSHFYVNGPSRAGKGRGFVMTNLLEWAGSVIVLDVKLENWAKTGPTRLALGQEVFVFAPGSTQSHCWNPLDFIRPWPSRATDLQNLAGSLIPLPERGDSYWAQTARGLLAALIGYVMESRTMEGRRTLRSVLRMFSSGRDLASLLVQAMAEEPELASFIQDGFRQHLGREEEQRSQFESNITTSMMVFNNRVVADVTSKSDFDIRDLRCKPYSVFVGAPVSDFGSVEPLIRLFIQQIHDVLLRHEPGKDEPHKLLLMLDEFYQFGRLPEIVLRAPLVAGYGFRIAIIAQNLPQLDEKYGQVTRNALLGNMDVKLFIGVGDDTTAIAASSDLGKHYVERSSWSSSRSNSRSSASVQNRFEEAPLMPPDMIKRIPAEQTLLCVRGHYGAVLTKLNYYTDRRFTEIVKRNQRLKGRLRVPDVKGVDEVPLFSKNSSAAPVVMVSGPAAPPIVTPAADPAGPLPISALPLELTDELDHLGEKLSNLEALLDTVPLVPKNREPMRIARLKLTQAVHGMAHDREIAMPA